jgi:cytidine diphosphoramidate kinase
MVIWLIGLSGAGKTTLGRELILQAKKKIPNIVLIDGDVIRSVFGNDLGHSLNDRKKNADRICQLCKYFEDQQIHVVCAILSIFHESQEWNRKNLKQYYEVYIDAPIDDLIQRDSKGLYQKALDHKAVDVAGMDLNFFPPLNPDLVINNTGSQGKLLSNVALLLEKICKEEA